MSSPYGVIVIRQETPAQPIVSVKKKGGRTIIEKYLQILSKQPRQERRLLPLDIF
tara:strand:+ start:1850 stop:2014 length:165 start_codon:yes stop_codon:yes gene_type:complete